MMDKCREQERKNERETSLRKERKALSETLTDVQRDARRPSDSSGPSTILALDMPAASPLSYKEYVAYLNEE